MQKLRWVFLEPAEDEERRQEEGAAGRPDAGAAADPGRASAAAEADL